MIFNDKNQFESVFKEHYNLSVNYANKLVLNSSIAEHVAQLTFIFLWDTNSEHSASEDLVALILNATNEQGINYLQSLKVIDGVDRIAEIEQIERKADSILAKAQVKVKSDPCLAEGSDITSLNIDEAWDFVKGKSDDSDQQIGSYDQAGRVLTIDSQEPTVFKLKSLIYMVVSVALVVAVFLYLNQGEKDEDPATWDIIEHAENDISLHLVDDTKLDLIEGSSLKFYTALTENERELWLEGKISVSANSTQKSKLIVHSIVAEAHASSDAKFDMESIEENGTATVTVHSGKVEVTNNSNGEKAIVEAGFSAIVSDEMAEILVSKTED